jgi:hypothetical protein
VFEEYQLGFSGWSKALAGALILGKVALILEHVSSGDWVRKPPSGVDVLLRTALYSFGIAIVMVLAKGLEGRHRLHQAVVRQRERVIRHRSSSPRLCLYWVYANLGSACARR